MTFTNRITNHFPLLEQILELQLTTCCSFSSRTELLKNWLLQIFKKKIHGSQVLILNFLSVFPFGCAGVAVTVNTIFSSLSCGYFPTMILAREKTIEFFSTFGGYLKKFRHPLTVSECCLLLSSLDFWLDMKASMLTEQGVRNWFDFKRCWLDASLSL